MGGVQTFNKVELVLFLRGCAATAKTGGDGAFRKALGWGGTVLTRRIHLPCKGDQPLGLILTNTLVMRCSVGEVYAGLLGAGNWQQRLA